MFKDQPQTLTPQYYSLCVNNEYHIVSTDNSLAKKLQDITLVLNQQGKEINVGEICIGLDELLECFFIKTEDKNLFNLANNRSLYDNAFKAIKFNCLDSFI